MKIIDLTHNIENGMQIYPGDPEIRISEGLIHESDYCHVDVLQLNSHTGTHIDAPYHFLPEGKKITDFAADKFTGKGITLDLRGKGENEAITVDDIEKALEKSGGKADAGLSENCIVVLATGWYEYFGTDKYLRHPYISREAAEYLVEKGVSIVAVDFLNVDSTIDEEWNAHPVLLGNDTLIVENLNNTGELDFGKEYTFSFQPLKITGSDGSPIRAIAIEE
ncbi:MAG: cyclase family protein [Firmicutes bacterium]|nr:cyclase family protein [Bacillota bacterium]